MSDGSGCGRGDRAKGVGADLVLPILAVLYGVYYLSTIWDLPFEARINGLLILGILFVLIAAFLIRTARDWLQGAVTLRFEGLLEPLPLLPRRIAFLLLTVGSVVAIPWLGFTLTTFLFMASSMAVLGIRSWRVRLTIAGLTAAAGYIFFIVVLDTRLPRGPVEHLLAWVL
ncbi:MAG: tripartite tricarboxylate transporter TctB family protein [Geminicoccaceae bacterium]